MTDFLNSITEFLNSPLGKLVYPLLAILVAYAANYVVTKQKIQTAKAESAQVADEKIKSAKNANDEIAQRKEKQSMDLIEDLRTNWMNTQGEVRELRKENEALQEKIETAEKVAKDAQERARQCQAQMNALSEQLAERTKESEANKSALTTLQEQHGVAVGKITTLEKEGDRLRDLLETKNAEVDQLNIKVVEMQHQLDGQSQELADAREELRKLKAKTDPLTPPQEPTTDLPPSPPLSTL